LLRSLLRGPRASDDKYSRGVVGFSTGSSTYPGAALLGVSSAMRCGVGLVRLASDDSVLRLVLEARPECVPVAGDGAAPRCDAWVFGSGVAGDDSAAKTRADALLASIDASVPLVIDAGALEFIDLTRIDGRCILTPHAGEAVRLLARFGVTATRTEVEADLIGVAQQLANLSGAVVLLKGSRTVVAAPGDVFWRPDEAPHELAVAGSGDVLAGILGALCAKAYSLAGREVGANVDLFEVAKTGVWLHSATARSLAEGGQFAALELADCLKGFVRELNSND
jgi:hydroxyethylthiazole kinase-like uncharacterized protein yjeF